MPNKLSIMLFVWLFQAVPGNSFAQASSSEHGSYSMVEMDLRDQSWNQGQIFELKAYWPFTWGNLITAKPEQTLEWSRVYVPGSWDQSYSKGPQPDAPLPAKGYGTYSMRVLVPQDIRAVHLYLPDMASAYELWYQGKRIGGNGVIGTRKETETPGYLPKTYTLEPVNGELQFYIQTSNFHYKWGGIWYAPKITDDSGLFELRDEPILLAISGGTILLMAAIFSLLLFASRPQTTKTLYFGLFCLAMGIRRLLIDERILYMGGYFDWHTLQAAENITMYLLLPLFLSYFRAVFPSTTHRFLPLFGWLIALPLCLIVMVTEVELYAHLNRPFQASLVLFMPIVIHNWYKALFLKVQSAKTFGLSLLILLMTIVNDILHYNYIIETNNLIHVGALAFVLFQITALMQRYLKNFQQIEALSESLAGQNKELLKVDKFKDDFLASTSHELRMPLHGIAGLARNLRDDHAAFPESAEKKIQLIESTAQRLSNIVNDILDIASIKHDKLELHPTRTHLTPVVVSAMETLRPLVKDKPLTLSYEIDDDANNVLADEQRLHQILFNLLGNAAKFTDQGSIAIAAKRVGDLVHVSVIDSGCGIAQDDLAKVFQSFETFQTGSQNEIRGTGLGLAITKRLVELQGGSITIDSKVSSGTTVSFSLPYQAQTSDQPITEPPIATTQQPSIQASADIAQTNGTREPRPSRESSLSRQGHLFFADDEEMNRELIAAQLAKAGYQVSLFANGAELLNALSDTQPDLILLDWMMPGMNGLDACSAIRRRFNAYEMPIMMLTARHQPDEISRAFKAGANDYLCKPHHEEELLARVNSLLSVRKLLEAARENEALSLEIAQQAEQKNKLEQANSRLMLSLDHTESAILLVNEELDIEFANAAARTLCALNSAPDDELSFSELLNPTDYESVQQLMSHPRESLEIKLLRPNQDLLDARVYCIREERELTLIVVIRDDETITESPAQSILTSLVQEMAENRQRMDQLESTIQQLRQDDSELGEQEETFTDPKTLVVHTMKTALLTWERHTHKNKADLAEQSRCWRVYLDGTTAKTRTMDKYLSVKTLPTKPRWRAVIKTAKFVLDHCDVDNKEQSELNALIDQLKQAFA